MIFCFVTRNQIRITHTLALQKTNSHHTDNIIKFNERTENSGKRYSARSLCSSLYLLSRASGKRARIAVKPRLHIPIPFFLAAKQYCFCISNERELCFHSYTTTSDKGHTASGDEQCFQRNSMPVGSPRKSDMPTPPIQDESGGSTPSGSS